MNSPARRRFLHGLGAGALASAALKVRAQPDAVRSLAFDHLHTGEKLVVDYFVAGAYVAPALASVDRLLRDFRTGDVAVIDTALLDLLHRLSTLTSSKRPFQIISGYRSPATNAALHQHSSGVASGSLHMRGQAIDIRLADVPLATLRDAARSVRGGGVGYYPASDFVHVDTGRVRTW